MQQNISACSRRLETATQDDINSHLSTSLSPPCPAYSRTWASITSLALSRISHLLLTTKGDCHRHRHRHRRSTSLSEARRTKYPFVISERASLTTTTPGSTVSRRSVNLLSTRKALPGIWTLPPVQEVPLTRRPRKARLTWMWSCVGLWNLATPPLQTGISVARPSICPGCTASRHLLTRMAPTQTVSFTPS